MSAKERFGEDFKYSQPSNAEQQKEVKTVKRVLVVEDEEDIRELMVQACELFGASQVVAAKDTNEAAKIINESLFNFDMISLDLALPIGNLTETEEDYEGKLREKLTEYEKKGQSVVGGLILSELIKQRCESLGIACPYSIFVTASPIKFTELPPERLSKLACDGIVKKPFDIDEIELQMKKAASFLNLRPTKPLQPQKPA